MIKFEEMTKYQQKIYLFKQEIKNKIGGKDGTRIANALLFMGIESMDDLYRFLKENSFVGPDRYHWRGIGIVGYYKLIDALYPKEEP